jgi:fumarate hydratase class I/fumarate hydratase subunit beta
MDFATPQLLCAGISVMLGKGKRAPAVIQACKETGSVYLAATGGAAAYLASFVTAEELIAWEDLGTEALRRLTLNGLPAFVAIDIRGSDIYQRGL